MGYIQQNPGVAIDMIIVDCEGSLPLSWMACDRVGVCDVQLPESPVHRQVSFAVDVPFGCLFPKHFIWPPSIHIQWPRVVHFS